MIFQLGPIEGARELIAFNRRQHQCNALPSIRGALVFLGSAVRAEGGEGLLEKFGDK
jgi:hypothetical protein